MQAIKSLNIALSLCLCAADGGHRPGASVALIMLSEAYSKVGKENEMIHSAQLAVKYAHNGKSLISDYNLPGLFVGQVSPSSAQASGPVPNRNLFCCRLLHESPTLLASYYNLAVVLESTGPEAESSALEWYVRVISTADKMQQEDRARAGDIGNTEINYKDVASQIEELKQFSSNARSRLNLKHGLLSAKSRLSSAAVLSTSSEVDEVTSRIKENTLKAISVTEISERPGMVDSKTRYQAQLKVPDSRHWDIGDAEDDLRILCSDLELLTTSRADRSLSSSVESVKGTRGKSDNIYVRSPYSRLKAQDSNTGALAFKQISVKPVVLSPNLSNQSINARLPASPVSLSRPQSARPRLLSDAAESMTLRLIAPITPPSGLQSTEDFSHGAPESIERLSKVRISADASTLSTTMDRSRLENILGGQKLLSVKTASSESILSKPGPSPLRQVHTSAEYCELQKKHLEKTLADRASSKKEGRMSTDRSSERRASASDVRLSSDMDKNNNAPRGNPSSNYAGEVIKSAASKTRDLRMLSRTVSDQSFIRATPTGKVRRKSELYNSTEFAKVAAAATRQQDFNVNRVEEKKGKASKLRQEMLTVRSRAAVAVQRLFRGHMARELVLVKRRKKSFDHRRDNFGSAGDTILSLPQKPVLSMIEEVRLERTAQAMVKGGGIGSTVQEPLKRRGSASSASSIEGKQTKKKSPVKKRQGSVTGPGISGMDNDSQTASATRLPSNLKTSDMSGESGSDAQTLCRAPKDYDADTRMKLVVGSNIEGRYMVMRLGKKSSWLPGQVWRVHPNGSFDVLYRNGTKEFGVRAEHIRLKSAALPIGGAAVRPRGSEGTSEEDLMYKHRCAIKLQSLARGYLERRRHRGLLLQIKRCMDLRAREKELNRRETKIWERFESMMSRAREDVARSLKTLKPQRIGKVTDPGSRKNSSTTAGTLETDYTLSPSSLRSSPQAGLLSPEDPCMSPTEMDESHLFSVSVSNDEIPVFPLASYPIESIPEETTDN